MFRNFEMSSAENFAQPFKKEGRFFHLNGSNSLIIEN